MSWTAGHSYTAEIAVAYPINRLQIQKVSAYILETSI